MSRRRWPSGASAQTLVADEKRHAEQQYGDDERREERRRARPPGRSRAPATTGRRSPESCRLRPEQRAERRAGASSAARRQHERVDDAGRDVDQAAQHRRQRTVHPRPQPGDRGDRRRREPPARGARPVRPGRKRLGIRRVDGRAGQEADRPAKANRDSNRYAATPRKPMLRRSAGVARRVNRRTAPPRSSAPRRRRSACARSRVTSAADEQPDVRPDLPCSSTMRKRSPGYAPSSAASTPPRSAALGCEHRHGDADLGARRCTSAAATGCGRARWPPTPATNAPSCRCSLDRVDVRQVRARGSETLRPSSRLPQISPRVVPK